MVRQTIPRSAVLDGEDLPGLTAVQTPQGALVATLRRAYARYDFSALEPTDEASLIEAMGAGNLCLVLDTPENREVAGPAAWYFADEGELAGLLSKVDQLDDDRLAELRTATARRAAEMFFWARVGDTYLSLLTGTGAGSASATG